MPSTKRIQPAEIDEDELPEVEEEEEAAEGDEDLDELEEPRSNKPALAQTKRPIAPQPQKPARTQPQSQPIQPKFQAFAQPERSGVIDTENNEIVAEGIPAPLASVFADILVRLDRIEALIGRV